MTFAIWVILILILLIIGITLTEAWRIRQKLQNSESMTTEDSEYEVSNLFTQLKNQLAGQIGIQGQNGDMASQNDAEHSTLASKMTKLSELTTRLSEQVNAKVQGVRSQNIGSRQPDLATQFRTWVTGAFDEEPEIRQWLSSLSGEQLEAYTTYLENFCQDMGFELSWLLEGRMAQEPALSSKLEKILLRYSQASHEAVSTQQEVMAFTALYDYLQKPVSHQNLALSQKVFGKLIEKGLTPINISDHLSLSGRERKIQISQVIQATAAEYPETFKSIVTEAMFDSMPLSSSNDQTVTHNNVTNNSIVEEVDQKLKAVPVSV